MNSDTMLAKWYDDSHVKNIVTVLDYYNFLQEADENKRKRNIANFIYNRFHSRYLKPFQFDDKNYKKYYKDGFSIMANCCLLIETLQAFKNGIDVTERNRNEQAFIEFFSENSNFKELKTLGNKFYVNIRCGILHQGETRGGWKINRKGKELFDEENKCINSVEFAERLRNSLTEYSKKLETEKWDSQLWLNFRKKMEFIISNCDNH